MAAPDLHEADAALDHPAGQQAVAAKAGRLRLVETVEFFGRFGFLAEVEQFGGANWSRAASS